MEVYKGRYGTIYHYGSEQYQCIKMVLTIDKMLPNTFQHRC